ncbi:isoprenylcysteine carboxylmethyltransferase family protein [Desulfobacterales bacterium HSG17]|nr:isoprenylcysteine carboxylmethyltransferase family protein [Desulfobacterales bacterium HSG17]
MEEIPMLKKRITDFASKYRIPVSRVIAVILLLIVLFSEHSWSENTIADFMLEFIGFILVGICTFGRLWASMYISGYKDDSLIVLGPYSMIRHPLYFFSFIGAVGLGLASENLIVIIVLPILYMLYYIPVMLSEEEKLTEIYGEEYINFMKKTPRFLPKFSSFNEPETYMIKARRFRLSFADVIWFFIFFMVLQFIEKLHVMGIVPILFTLP